MPDSTPKLPASVPGLGSVELRAIGGTFGYFKIVQIVLVVFKSLGRPG